MDNSKNVVKRLLKSQFDANLDLEFEINNKGRVWAENKHVFKLEMNSVVRKGLYFGFMEHDGLRLSMDGTFLVGPKAKKNVLQINREEMTEWLRGYALEKKAPKGYLVLKYEEHYVGCGKSNGERIWNNVPKERRIRNITSL
jgi:NOL1/NOP2/fmu family ribosome biogenesis protein